MKYHFGLKLAVFLLSAAMLVVMLGSTLSIAFLSENDLYSQTPAQWEGAQLHDRASAMADMIVRRYTATELGKLNREQLEYANRLYTDQDLSDWYSVFNGCWDYWITDLDGKLMENGVKLSEQSNLTCFAFTTCCDYPIHATPEESQIIEQTQNWTYRDYYYTETEEHFLYYYNSPTYHVYLRFQPKVVQIYTGISRNVLECMYSIRYALLGMLFVSLLLFIGGMTYLCFAAGHTPKEPTPKLRGLNRLPLDLYLGICGAGAVLLTVGAVVIADDTIFIDTTQISPPAMALVLLMLFAAALLVIGFFYTFAAQIKQKKGYWWRHSIIGWILIKIGKGVRFCFRGSRRLFSMLPLVWQWLLTAAAMVVVPLICLLLAAASYHFFRFIFGLWFVAACIADIGLVCYGAYAFGTLYKGAKAMAKGNLQDKVPTKYLFGAFRNFADELNALADAAIIAARNQTKSERMKTELITNVSHDIKTPLTSIINYVDLLQSPHTEAEGQQYLEVLSRQSSRMKKLIEDLMDMSKASSGNLQVSISRLDVTETLNQALGEFADKLAAARLIPIFHSPQTPVLISADGRHTWRVLSNLLSNVVKYALPGTRVYVDLVSLNGCVQISLKNISAEPLNVSAEELTERFVRGDTSRNTEGSGLGLNIAKSLMELQKGSLELLVDGDLFKVTLTFPAA